MVAPPPTSASTVGPEPPPPAAGKPRSRKPKALAIELALTLLLAFFLFIIISFALQTVRVEGPSMRPTLYGDADAGNDILFADKLSYHLHSPNRGDIIILTPPAKLNTDYIKRIVGLPGDVIEIVPRGFVVNGKPTPRAEVLIEPGGHAPLQVLEEPYLPDQTQDPWTQSASCCRSDTGTASDSPNPFTIPNDDYFVMGDNRNASQDSRAPDVGLIPRANIIGRAWVRIWPLSRFGFLGQGSTLQAALALPLALPFPLVRAAGRRRPRRRDASTS